MSACGVWLTKSKQRKRSATCSAELLARTIYYPYCNMGDEIGATVGDIFINELDHKKQSARLNSLLQTILTCDQEDTIICNNVTRVAEEVVNRENVSMVVSRQFVSDIVAALDNMQPNLVKEIARALLDVVQSRLISYEEQVTDLRYRLAAMYEFDGDYEEAAKILMAIPLETGQRAYPAEVKMRTYLRIAQLALDYGNSAEAETFANRASMLCNELSKDDELIALFKALYARVLDHRKKFIEAAQRYYEFSLFPTVITDCERYEALTNAISCTILASPGAQRSRMLTTLYKDERCASSPAFTVLQKFYFERLIRNDELQEFERSLSSHQRVIHGGWSVLQRAIFEHNFIAISKIFTNITFEQLGGLLGVDNEQAEKMAWEMFANERVAGFIDQIEEIIHFTPFVCGETSRQVDAVAEFDQQIDQLCQDVNNVTDMILQKHGSWVKNRGAKLQRDF